MPCLDPISAARSVLGGRVALGRSFRSLLAVDPMAAEDALKGSLLLPCGSCVGCQISRAREWAIRCELELQLHPAASFVTLTYSDRYVPPTLVKRDLSLFLRYMRRRMPRDAEGKRLPLRFFGCGEYGERRERPHYHAILFGTADREAAEGAWGKGFVTMDIVTPGRISYTAGYCAKKLGFFRPKGEEVDHTTGEVYTHQPPFLQMSRRPGVAGDFRKHRSSWRTHAIWSGRPFPVPRFLHQSWKESASESQLAQLELEKIEARGVLTIRELLASADIAAARVRNRSERAQL